MDRWRSKFFASAQLTWLLLMLMEFKSSENIQTWWKLFSGRVQLSSSLFGFKNIVKLVARGVGNYLIFPSMKFRKNTNLGRITVSFLFLFLLLSFSPSQHQRRTVSSTFLERKANSVFLNHIHDCLKEFDTYYVADISSFQHQHRLSSIASRCVYVRCIVSFNTN